MNKRENTSDYIYLKNISDKKDKINIIGLIISLLIITMPFLTVNISGVGILLILSLPLLLLSIINILNKSMIIWFSKEIRYLISFLFYGLLSYIWSPVVFTIDSNVLRAYIIVFCISIYALNNKEKSLIILASLLTCFYITYSFITNSFDEVNEYGRQTIIINGFPQDPNYISFIFFPSITAFSLYLINSKKIISKAICIGVLLLLLMAILKTGSRGATFSFLFIIILVFINQYKISIRGFIGISLALIMLYYIFPLLLTYLPEDVAYRFTRDMIQGDDMGGRGSIWLNVFNINNENILTYIFGHGCSSSIHLLGMATHNYLLQIFVEYGFVGLFLFIRFVFHLLKKYWKNDPFTFALFGGCLFMSMSLSVNANYNFWLTIGMCLVLGKTLNKNYSIQS